MNSEGYVNTHTVPARKKKCSMTSIAERELMEEKRGWQFLYTKSDNSHTLSGYHVHFSKLEWGRSPSAGQKTPSRGYIFMRILPAPVPTFPRTEHRVECACHLPLSYYYCGLEIHYHPIFGCVVFKDGRRQSRQKNKETDRLPELN